MTEPANPTQRLGAFVAGAVEAPFAPDLKEKAAICLLDALGLAVLARDEPTTAAMRAILAPAAPGPMTARVWSDGRLAGLADAAGANALAIHALFHDDCENSSWSHPGSLVVPAAATLAEAKGASLERTLQAIVAGYAAMHWLGAEEKVALALIGRGVRTSPSLGTIGAAAAAAVMLGLDGKQATNAVAIATSITGGLLEPVRTGSDEWRVQNAHATQGGLLAALLAERGVAGAPDALGGVKGLLRSLAGLDETPSAWRSDPRPESFRAVWAKPWATLGDNVAVVAAAKLLFDEGVDVARIRAIRIAMNRQYAEYPGTSFPGPYETVVQAIAATRFATAAMLVHGRLDYAVSVERRQEPGILRLVELAHIEPDDSFSQFDASVELEMDDGSRRRREAKEAPRTQIFHDRATASALLEQRLAGPGGRPPGTGRALAEALFSALDRAPTVALWSVLGRAWPGV